MKLSSLTTIDKIKLAAELDGWTELENNKSNTGLIGYRYQHKYAKLTGKELIPNYATSYDAIIPLIQKQDDTLINKFIYTLQIDILKRRPIVGSDEAWFMASELDCWHQLKATPSQLLDALLVATGKAKL